MTQQDIVNELNRIVVGYNINWDTIKFDADRAIMKINAYIGANYPMMSEIMLSPKHRYALNVKGSMRPIFPERYILTVVIPYIATEVLARDEEFTTIYNKYAMDVENGLFDMFQNEYNRVPYAFRQDADIGVFYSNEHPYSKVHGIVPDKDFTFNIYYHINSDYKPVQNYTFDLDTYVYGAEAQIKNSTVLNYIQGIYFYDFAGWNTDPNGRGESFKYGDICKIKGDIHLYAMWDKECVLSVTNGIVTIKKDYAADITELIIPEYVEGKLVTTIHGNFVKDAVNIKSVTLPNTDVTLKANSFNCGNKYLGRIIFPAYDYLRGKPSYIIEGWAIGANALLDLYIPYSVKSIAASGIVGVPLVQCEVPESEKPADWNEKCFNDCKQIEWGVSHG